MREGVVVSLFSVDDDPAIKVEDVVRVFVNSCPDGFCEIKVILYEEKDENGRIAEVVLSPNR